ncbi:MAG: transcription-repair coupling factor [Candidatus Atribacteria bacterium]|nr:transcription-repair coupling factor [Candidatus Atribacteria bacterium]MCD6349828.1 transcription-repair coupling factor [Candidatus Atribacteria bacterium]
MEVILRLQTFLKKLIQQTEKHQTIYLKSESLLRPLFALALASGYRLPLIYVVPDRKTQSKAKTLLEELSALFFASEAKIFVFQNSPRQGIILQEQLRNKKPFSVFLLKAEDLSCEVEELEFFMENSLLLEKNREYPRTKLLEKLEKMGYQREEFVREPGSFALRGEVLDIFSPQMEHPVRTYWFANLLEKMRFFKADTQRTFSETERVLVIPASGHFKKLLLQEAINREKGIVFWDDVFHEKAPLDLPYQIFSGIVPRKEHHTIEILSEPLPFFGGQMEKFLDYLRENAFQKVLITLPAEKLENLTAILKEAKIPFSDKIHSEEKVIVVPSGLPQGFSLTELGMAVFSAREILGFTYPHSSFKRTASRREGELLREIKEGDYVVHEEHGIGIFKGLKELVVEGVRRVYIEIEYAASDRLYVPVENAHLVQKYVGGEGTKPRLQRLGTDEWNKIKERTRKQAGKIAKELVELYARRMLEGGHAFSPDTTWQKQLELAFPYLETPDQKKTIEEVKKDMESPRPMDRLVCGDVGFGKTEIAIRASFKAVMDGKQVALLAPTTLLSEQHYITFRERMKDFPVKIEVLNRFKSPAQQRKIVEEIKEGQVDIVIGTHRLLQKDIVFKDLGLLIIDEEQRFGVFHKEKLKQLKVGVDVLTLTATPIPRTLYLSLLGIRDISCIETPPEGRKNIHTFVLPRKKEHIQQAIARELERQGQIFYVCPRIKDLMKIAEEIKEMFPKIDFALAHGRMSGKELEKIMIEFYQSKIPLLLCTTIIEIGLDIPSVNTLIVDPATHFGLAQLYQLRGRIGRGNREAYAYFLYPHRLSHEARERLNALLEFSETGSGFKLALRDLEIRGAGNILGPEQHGFIQEVGFHLYSRLLEEEIARLKGEFDQLPPDFSVQISLKEEAYLPDYYISSESERLRYYQKLLRAQTEEEIRKIAEEMQDRFGKMPPPTSNLFSLTKLKYYAKITQVEEIKQEGSQIFIVGSLETLVRLQDAFQKNALPVTLTKYKDRAALRIPLMSARRLTQLLEKVIQNE